MLQSIVQKWEISVFQSPEAAVRKCISKYVFLKDSQYSQENTCVFNTGVFLWVLQNF